MLNRLQALVSESQQKWIWMFLTLGISLQIMKG